MRRVLSSCSLRINKPRLAVAFAGSIMTACSRKVRRSCRSSVVAESQTHTRASALLICAAWSNSLLACERLPFLMAMMPSRISCSNSRASIELGELENAGGGIHRLYIENKKLVDVNHSQLEFNLI